MSHSYISVYNCNYVRHRLLLNRLSKQGNNKHLPNTRRCGLKCWHYLPRKRFRTHLIKLPNDENVRLFHKGKPDKQTKSLINIDLSSFVVIQSCWLCGASNNSRLGQVTQPIGYDAGFNLSFVVSISTSRPFGYQVLRKASRIGTHFRPHFPRHGSHIPGRTLYEWMP